MKQQWNFIKIVSLLSLITLLAASLFVPNVFAVSSVYDDKTATETVLDMGIGWNLGNTLEACGDWINPSSITNYETAWGNPVTTKQMIDGIRAAGFKSIRIPVAWSNMMAPDYTINQQLINRVKEVVGYCSDNDMYVIVNIHWDGGWFEKFATEYDEAMKKYTSIWTQISNNFKDYPQNLIFESLNEEGHWDTIWNRWSGSTGADKTRAYNILNNINQRFVDIVRASGGNNASRCLLIAGYATDIDLTIDDCFKMPQDTISNKLIISVHYYTPATFTILTEDASWGKAAYTWGTEAEINQVKIDFQKMKNKFANNAVPVIIGEYGTVIRNKDPESVRRYISTVCKTAYDLGFCPMFWDNGEYYSRSELKFRDPQLASIFYEYKDLSRITPTPTVTPPPVSPSPAVGIIGDLNNDDMVNSTDLTLMKRYILKIVNSLPAEDDLFAADLNMDYKVDSTDLTILKRYILKIIPHLPFIAAQ
ncbi:MAG: cellulase family glycosylhydrolase [Bacillota bacterium]